MAKYLFEAVLFITIMAVVWAKDKEGATWHYWTMLGLLILHEFMF